VARALDEALTFAILKLVGSEVFIKAAWNGVSIFPFRLRTGRVYWPSTKTK
jgi:hypothetical protein